MADMLLVSVGAGLDCRERFASMALLYGLATSTGGGEGRNCCLCNISVEPIVHAVYSSVVSWSLPAGSTRLREAVVDEELGRGALVAL